jgi:hypothetical protein
LLQAAARAGISDRIESLTEGHSWISSDARTLKRDGTV